MSIPNHLRTYRKRTGLSQDEVAFLLGCKTGTRICRYERFQQNPHLKTLLAYEILFRTPLQKLFPGVSRGVERDVTKRIYFLIKKLTKAGHVRLASYKIRVLSALAKREVLFGGAS